MCHKNKDRVRFIDWETGKVKLSHEVFLPRYWRNVLVEFVGVKTGTVLCREFDGALEFGR